MRYRKLIHKRLCNRLWKKQIRNNIPILHVTEKRYKNMKISFSSRNKRKTLKEKTEKKKSL